MERENSNPNEKREDAMGRVSGWERPQWLDSEDGEKFRELLRSYEGLKALEFAEQRNLEINDSLVSDALDATSGSLVFSRAEQDSERIQLREEELKIIKNRWGNPHLK